MAAWRPALHEVATDQVGGTVSLAAAAASAVMVIVGASAQSIVSVSFFVLSLLVALDFLSGTVRVLTEDFRYWRDHNEWRGSFTWRMAIDSPIKWLVYSVLTLSSALVVLLFQEAGFHSVGVGAIAFLHAALGLQEALSIAGNLAVWPSVADAFTRFLARFHIVAAERFSESVVREISEEELQAALEKRMGKRTGRLPALRPTGSDN